VGILAHIDAGKTTTTERMLYYAGFMTRVGEVHRGDTVMDFMEQERDRGITISAAAITFLWQRNQINLIDTPGHVDFTVEVERALRVLDGAVVVLDASAGVQAQTMTVWRQANRHRVPRIAFLNKLDKANASVDHSLATMRSKLGVEPLLVQIPLGHGSSFKGVIDLIDMRLLTWSKDSDVSWGKQYAATPLLEGHELFAMAAEERTRLIDRIGDFDDTVARAVLETECYESVSAKLLKDALRRITLKNSSALVTLCGSAFKNISVQPLLDAVVDFLPSPSDVEQRFLAYFPADAFCGLAFKIVHHPQKGVLTFIRVYSGKLTEGDNLFNMNRNAAEKTVRLMIAFADDFKVVKEVAAGNIAVVSGLKETITGDTLVHKASVAREAAKKWSEQSDGSGDEGHLPGVPVPDPVFYCSVEPPSAMYQKQLDLALANLVREDPSLGVRTDLETGQTVLSGMGELHLEIIKDRILKEYKIEADLGPLSIAYREAPTKTAIATTVFNRRILDKSYELSVEMSVEPIASEGKATLSL
jgi:elongation factor G